MGDYVSIVTNNGDDAMDETNDAVRVNIVASSGGVALDNDWVYTPVSMSAGTNATNLSIVAAGAAATVKYLTAFELVVTAASPTADIIVKLLNGSGGAVIWQTAIGAGSPIGTRVGFAMARGIPVTAATGIFLTTTGNTGSPVLTPSATGYTK